MGQSSCFFGLTRSVRVSIARLVARVNYLVADTGGHLDHGRHESSRKTRITTSRCRLLVRLPAFGTTVAASMVTSFAHVNGVPAPGASRELGLGVTFAGHAAWTALAPLAVAELVAVPLAPVPGLGLHRGVVGGAKGGGRLCRTVCRRLCCSLCYGC